jgi:hypothetical protein
MYVSVASPHHAILAEGVSLLTNLHIVVGADREQGRQDEAAARALQTDWLRLPSIRPNDTGSDVINSNNNSTTNSTSSTNTSGASECIDTLLPVTEIGSSTLDLELSSHRLMGLVQKTSLRGYDPRRSSPPAKRPILPSFFLQDASNNGVLAEVEVLGDHLSQWTQVLLYAEGRLLWVSHLRFRCRRAPPPGSKAAAAQATFLASCNGAKELVCLRVTTSSTWGFVDALPPPSQSPALYLGRFAAPIGDIATRLPQHIAAGTTMRASFLCRIAGPCCPKDGRILVPIEIISPTDDTPPSATAQLEALDTTAVSFIGERYIPILRSIARVGLELFLRDVWVHLDTGQEDGSGSSTWRLEADHFSDLRLPSSCPPGNTSAALSPELILDPADNQYVCILSGPKTLFIEA